LERRTSKPWRPSSGEKLYGRWYFEERYDYADKRRAIHTKLLGIVNRDDENIHPSLLDIEGWITLFSAFKSIKLIYRPSLLLPIPPMIFGRYITSRGRPPNEPSMDSGYIRWLRWA